MKDHYVKDYKEKELRQYILAYLLITVASIALHTDFSADNENLLDTLLKMAAIDIWVSGLSVLVVILNEIWPDAMKTEIVYGNLPLTGFHRVTRLWAYLYDTRPYVVRPASYCGQ